jgi:signal transduction histidine kinase
MKSDEKSNILLIDDKPENLLALEAILQDLEVTIFKATSGNKGLALLLENEFALVLMDVQMPGMDGFETARLMRGLEKTRHIPIIFITAINKDEKYIFKGYETGAVDYLFKPVEGEILTSKVKVFLNLHHQQKLLERQAHELELKMTELNTVLLQLQGKEKLLKKQAIELKNVNQELQDFAYIVSHDLKAPLRAIGSLANWISTDYADKFDEDGIKQMNLLIARVKRMHDLINGVLQYSRLGRCKEAVTLADLNVVVREVLDLIAPQDNFDIQVETNLPQIWCEKTRISQVFQNLISNAIKYIDKPVGRIRIGALEQDAIWEFYVKDNGPGIDKKHFQKIFQIFQTLNPRDEIESTGVGLTSVKKIVEMYQGKVWLDSEMGVGSTFYFTLPKQHPVDAPEIPESPE